MRLDCISNSLWRDLLDNYQPLSFYKKIKNSKIKGEMNERIKN